MDGIEVVRAGEEVLAIILRAEAEPEGNRFFTPDYFIQQGRLFSTPAGGKVPLHNLVPAANNSAGCGESLFVRSGRIQVDLYYQNNLVASRYLKRGDCIMFAKGAHELKMLESSVLFEISQGPLTKP